MSVAAQPADRSASDEWRMHWPLVIAAMAGLSFTAIASSSIGLFMEPLGREFGWSRAEISLGLSVYALVAVPLSPFVGALIDRWGSRRLAIPGMIFSASAFAAFSLTNGSLTLWFGQWLLYSLAALAIRMTVWSAAVSSVFSVGRGLALAVTLSGSAITLSLAPITAQWLIDSYGWRSAYFWLGAGWGAFALALLVPFFFDARDRHRRSRPLSSDERGASLILPGLTMRDAARSAALIKLALATLLTILMLTAITVHLVPILNEKGISRETAALMAGSAGIASICGKLFTGWALDRWSGGWIGAISLALPAIPCLMLLLEPGNHFFLALLAGLILGYSGGAFVQVCTYFTSRYGGMRNFGKIFGVMASLIAVGTGVGPVVAGLIYDQFGSYWLLLISTIPVAFVSGILLMRLGPYPNWEPAQAAPAR